MPAMPTTLRGFFKRHIEHTIEKAPVPDEKFMLARLPDAVAALLDVDHGKHAVFITARALKHLYDKKPAEEFSCLLQGLPGMIRDPAHLYLNREGKRAGYCIIGSYEETAYVCAIEIKPGEGGAYVPTAFRNRDGNYLSKCTLLWSRGTAIPIAT